MELTFAREYLTGLSQVFQRLPLEAVGKLADALLAARASGQVIYLVGNGGSAALASHFACDLAKTTMCPGKPRFRAVALTDNVPLLTAWGNDASYDLVFSEQLEPLLRPRDVLLAISGSGNSPNVLKAVELANARGAVPLALTGFAGGKLLGLVQHAVVVPSDNMQHIEDVHAVLCHLLTSYLREQLRREA